MTENIEVNQKRITVDKKVKNAFNHALISKSEASVQAIKSKFKTFNQDEKDKKQQEYKSSSFKNSVNTSGKREFSELYRNEEKNSVLPFHDIIMQYAELDYRIPGLNSNIFGKSALIMSPEEIDRHYGIGINLEKAKKEEKYLQNLRNLTQKAGQPNSNMTIIQAENNKAKKYSLKSEVQVNSKPNDSKKVIFKYYSKPKANYKLARSGPNHNNNEIRKLKKKTQDFNQSIKEFSIDEAENLAAVVDSHQYKIKVKTKKLGLISSIIADDDCNEMTEKPRSRAAHFHDKALSMMTAETEAKTLGTDSTPNSNKTIPCFDKYNNGDASKFKSHDFANNELSTIALTNRSELIAEPSCNFYYGNMDTKEPSKSTKNRYKHDIYSKLPHSKSNSDLGVPTSNKSKLSCNLSNKNHAIKSILPTLSLSAAKSQEIINISCLKAKDILINSSSQQKLSGFDKIKKSGLVLQKQQCNSSSLPDIHRSTQERANAIEGILRMAKASDISQEVLATELKKYFEIYKKKFPLPDLYENG